MKNLIVLAIVAALAWFAYGRYQATVARTSVDVVAPAHASGEPQPTSEFSCDGRTHCSQMRSCEEAIYFIQHCPNTKMDGNNDGVPCERQWCN